MEERQISENRNIDWVDIAKGIAIILIVIGHTYPLFGPVSINVHYLSLPLFFLIAGYLFNFEKYEFNLKLLIVKSFNRLILPGMIFILFFTQFQYVFSESGLLSFIYGIGMEIPDFGIYRLPFGCWFLCCLFVTKILFCMFLKILKKFRVSDLVSFYIFFITALIGANIGQKIYLPWSIDIALVTLYFMFWGYFLRKIRFFEQIKKSYAVYLIIALIIIYIYCVFSGIFNLNMRKYGIIAISLHGAIFLSVFACYISKYISTAKFLLPIKIILQYFGKNSILIFLFHFVEIPGYNHVLQVIFKLIICCLAIECFARFNFLFQPHKFSEILENKK